MKGRGQQHEAGTERGPDGVAVGRLVQPPTCYPPYTDVPDTAQLTGPPNCKRPGKGGEMREGHYERSRRTGCLAAHPGDGEVLAVVTKQKRYL